MVVESQEIMSHAEEDAVSVLYITMAVTVVNHNTIQSIITAVNGLDDKISSAINESDEKIWKLDNFLQVYLHLHFMVQELRKIVLKGSLLYDHLQIGLKTLPLSHLFPSYTSFSINCNFKGY